MYLLLFDALCITKTSNNKILIKFYKIIEFNKVTEN